MSSKDFWLWPFGGLFESDVTKVEAPRVSKEQEEMMQQIWATVSGYMAKAAEPYEKPLAAPTPALFGEAYREYEDSPYAGLIDRAITGLLAAEPSYVFEPGAATKRWKETYATPVMETWRETVLPMIEESYNIPGAAYGTPRAKGVLKATGEMYGQYVAPTLFEALQTGEKMGFAAQEAAVGRLPGAISLPYGQTMEALTIAGKQKAEWQAPLSAAYQDYLRTITAPLGYAQTLAGMATAPTMDWGMFREPSIAEQLAPYAMAAAAAM